MIEFEAQLRMLLDERAIGQQLGRFARILDSKDFDSLGDVFAPDVIFDYGQEGDKHGLEELGAWMHRFLDLCGGTQHHIGNLSIEIDGDSASSRSYIFARHQRRTELGGPVFDTSGEYLDRWERRSEGWRIVRRDAKWFVVHGDGTIVGVDEIRLD